MNTYEIIRKKRDGKVLEDEEIKYVVREFTEGSLPDYQMSAWMMAVWFNGMTSAERAALTGAMTDTGRTFEYPPGTRPLVDKHSTGGVGDGVSLVLVPLVASFDVKIPMMSGRGLGHTGGTLDKLESIPGLEVEFSQDEVNRCLAEVGALIMGQTQEVAPADRKMYELRDVTATIDSVDLIASSIMSKKIAENMDALVLDVKTGSGAFMTSLDRSLQLARAMIEIGDRLEKDVEAFVTNMNQPLGRAVGNANEMIQAIETLKGEGPEDLTELVCHLAGSMLKLAGREPSTRAGSRLARQRLESGDALNKLREIIDWQSGDTRVIDDYSRFPSAENSKSIVAREDGFVDFIDAYEVGMAAVGLGAGRSVMTDKVDPAAGIFVEKKVGDPVEAGDTLFRFDYNDPRSDPVDVENRLRSAVRLSQESPDTEPLIHGVVNRKGSFDSLEE